MPKRPDRTERIAAARRASVVNALRGCDWTSADKAWKTAALPAANLVPTVLQSMRLEQRVAESQILQVWDRVMDPILARHARPVSLHAGTLFVSVDSNVWLSEIVRYRSREILERLQLVAGPDAVRKVSYRLGS